MQKFLKLLKNKNLARIDDDSFKFDNARIKTIIYEAWKRHRFIVLECEVAQFDIQGEYMFCWTVFTDRNFRKKDVGTSKRKKGKETAFNEGNFMKPKNFSRFDETANHLNSPMPEFSRRVNMPTLESTKFSNALQKIRKKKSKHIIDAGIYNYEQYNFIIHHVLILVAMATGHAQYRPQWEKLEYLGNSVLEPRLLKIAESCLCRIYINIGFFYDVYAWIGSQKIYGDNKKNNSI
ncbi:hypothetical protein C2G38_2253951 [Gigaspora rosea]|uniref:RNase III domain-containing protein n=1 Tax=Gigaspora rosea TaxID=44941 RepID=A0A397U802_9GLOM|nr:hypothetical protein C2G38_2253951 [Gigaspora rosea]